uniref:Uncharacterized protein n=1 Tax=Physcomitrium patens TaxID=3218 RepID=A0A2K1IYD4_PHYPA|nr:hypothetical protein PHYPA_024109 [Physcomitrium patens]
MLGTKNPAELYCRTVAYGQSSQVLHSTGYWTGTMLNCVTGRSVSRQDRSAAQEGCKRSVAIAQVRNLHIWVVQAAELGLEE